MSTVVAEERFVVAVDEERLSVDAEQRRWLVAARQAGSRGRSQAELLPLRDGQRLGEGADGAAALGPWDGRLGNGGRGGRRDLDSPAPSLAGRPAVPGKIVRDGAEDVRR